MKTNESIELKSKAMLLNFLIFLFILITISLVAIILAQPGKGFGLESSQSGASKTVFGSSGPRMIQRRVTMVLFSIWIVFTFLLGWVISSSRNWSSALQEEEALEELSAAVQISPEEEKGNDVSLETILPSSEGRQDVEAEPKTLSTAEENGDVDIVNNNQDDSSP